LTKARLARFRRSRNRRGSRGSPSPDRSIRLAVYTDYAYRRQDGTVYAERAFALFLAELAGRVERMVVVGRLNPHPGRERYALPEEIDFVPLPYYPSAADLKALKPMLRSLSSFWHVLREVDAAWVLGPHPPLALAFAALTVLGRRQLILGVRQDLPRYVRTRHPGRRPLHLVADGLDAAYRAMARLAPTVVVGPDLARRYGQARRLLPIYVSLIRDEDIVGRESALERSYDGELRVLTVGRIEAEKNPLLLADVLARLRSNGRRWRLVVCGEGPLEPVLAERLVELGVADQAELLGYLPVHGGLLELYRGSHVFLHVSWTEGVPQVLFEAFASGLPVVATAVGGVASAAEGAALLVPPGDAGAAAAALAKIAEDGDLRERLLDAGLAKVRASTLDAEVQRVAEFLSSAVAGQNLGPRSPRD
jgi:glycosyltransferase involved in cell wall biosynthesis